MALSNTRRNLIFARGSLELAFRPPWSIKEDDFVELCTRCGECYRECPSNVIRIADGGFPELDFSDAGCDFCEVCAQVCAPKALSLYNFPALNLFAEINDDCFAKRDVICRCCGEICEPGAIQFKPARGGSAQVYLDSDKCNGCGECIHSCPAHSITMQHRPIEENPS